MGSIPISSTMDHPPRRPSVDDLVDRFREICLALPDVEERLNHGIPTFGVAKRPAFCNLHESPVDGRPNLWFKAAAGVQAELVEQEPERFFVPPTSARGAGWASAWTWTSTGTRWPAWWRSAGDSPPLDALSPSTTR